MEWNPEISMLPIWPCLQSPSFQVWGCCRDPEWPEGNSVLGLQRWIFTAVALGETVSHLFEEPVHFQFDLVSWIFLQHRQLALSSLKLLHGSTCREGGIVSIPGSSLNNSSQATQQMEESYPSHEVQRCVSSQQREEEVELSCRHTG